MKKCLLTAVPASMLMTVPAFCTEQGTANAAVVSAMTSTAADMTATATAILPIALGVLSLYLVVKFGIKFFKGVSGK